MKNNKNNNKFSKTNVRRGGSLLNKEKKFKLITLGFTLIELLAVIVILAIIAVIAVPIILNIINDSKENAQLRSAEIYLKGLETSIATSTINNNKVEDNTYEIMSNGNICLEYDEKNKCTNELEVEMNGEKPNSGIIIVLNGKIKDIELKYSDKKVVLKDKNGNLVYEKTFTDICIYLNNNGVAPKTAGAKYSCEVKPGTSYNFYVLTTPKKGDITINLIMDRNICEDGTPTEAGKKCLIPWNNETGQSTTAYGPVTAMTYLYNATKEWINISPVNYTYVDKELQGTTKDNTSYTSFISTNGVATITALDGTKTAIIGSETKPLRTRMPIFSRNSTKIETEVKSSNGSNNYLYENLDGSNWLGSGTQPSNIITGILGYWTLSSDYLYNNVARYVYLRGTVDNRDKYVTSGGSIGVRPVINLKL